MNARRHFRRLRQIKPARLITDLSNPLEALDNKEFALRFRFDKDTFLILFRLLEVDLMKGSNRGLPVPPIHCLLLTLRFLATGTFQLVQGDLSGISQPTVSRIISKVIKVIASRRAQFIKFPPREEEFSIRNDFYSLAGFPGVIGCIDCTHIAIQSPGGENAELYRNRKGYFSINVQAVCDAHLRFLSLVAQWPGSVHDSRIFYNSSLCASFENREIDGILLGDNGYPNKAFLFTPIIHPQSPQERRYNRAHIATRNTVERSFGLWKRRFHSIHSGLRLSMENNLATIVATATLHNFAILHRQEIDHEEEIVQLPDAPLIFDGEDGIPDERSGTAIRRAFIDRHF